MAPPTPQAQLRNPFDVLPANLFNLFSTQGIASLQRHYMTILLRLYALTEFTRWIARRSSPRLQIA